MADPALAALSAAQRERLALLGFDLLVLRACDAEAPVATVMDPVSPRIVIAGASPDDRSGIVRGILAALGLRAAQVASGPCGDVPVLAFGDPGPADAIRLPALPALREAHSKRAAWLLLRRLRRRLQEGGGPS